MKESIDQWMPDKNLQKAVADNMGISVEELTPLKLKNFNGATMWGDTPWHDLELEGKNITNLKGLEYAENIKEFYLQDNNISDISPLLNNKNHYGLVNLSNNAISDISMLKKVFADEIDISDQRIDLPKVSIMGPDYNYYQPSTIISGKGTSINIKGSDGAKDWEEKDGGILWKGCYSNEVNWQQELRSTWSYKNYKVEFPKIKILVFSGTVHQPYERKEASSVNQTFDFYGIGTSAGKDEHFAKLEYSGKDQAVLYVLSDYGCQVQPYFKGTYASIKVTNDKGKELFSKKYKGTDWSHKDQTEVPMPEGATVAIYHAEPSRLQTNSDDSLKQNAVTTTYFYVVKDHKLVSQKLEKQQFKFLGLGDYEFAKVDIVGGNATIDTKYMAQGPHCYFKDQVYASITIKDEKGKVIKKKEYIGQQNEPAGIKEVSLKDGYTVTIYHAEPSRLQTNNDQQLKQHQKENTFSYIYKNQKLIEQ